MKKNLSLKKIGIGLLYWALTAILFLIMKEKLELLSVIGMVLLFFVGLGYLFIGIVELIPEKRKLPKTKDV